MGESLSQAALFQKNVRAMFLFAFFCFLQKKKARPKLSPKVPTQNYQRNYKRPKTLCFIRVFAILVLGQSITETINEKPKLSTDRFGAELPDFRFFFILLFFSSENVFFVFFLEHI